MQFLDLTLETPAENLALDEALLLDAEQAAAPREVLRLWEPSSPMVVVGRSSKLEMEVDAAACAKLNIPILRRGSGGLAIVAGPGCLMYAVVLSYVRRSQLRAIDLAHAFVLNALAGELQKLLPEIALQGTSDLTWCGKKFSGNSVRCKRDHLLYHGTLLYDFPLELISTCLRSPPRQPDYRAGRSHTDFVTNLPLSVEQLRTAVRQAFPADEPLQDWPRELVTEIASRVDILNECGSC